jgi:hypothetical protein
VSGLQYVIINSPPALGVVHDAAGHERPEAIRKYQVYRQNMTGVNLKLQYTVPDRASTNVKSHEKYYVKLVKIYTPKRGQFRTYPK